MSLMTFKIENFRGITSLSASPDGKSITLSGKNGTGKTSAIDALWWGLGGALDGEVVRNGTDRAETVINFGQYIVTRKQTLGKRPTLAVKDADGRTYGSPTELLKGFIGALGRQAFSVLSDKEQAATLRKLAPGLDVSDLDAVRAAHYEERTLVNRDAAALKAQLAGMVVPEAIGDIGEEIDIAEVAGLKLEAARQAGRNRDAREKLASTEKELLVRAAAVDSSHRTLVAARAEVARLDEELKRAQGEVVDLGLQIGTMRPTVKALVEPDIAAIDRQIAEAKQHNVAVRQRQQAGAEIARAVQACDKIAAQSRTAEAASEALTVKLKEIDEQKAARLASAKLPIGGLAIGAGGVTLDDGQHGPVSVAALNTAQRMRLDVVIGAALGYRLIAVRDASLLDLDGRAALADFAHQHGVQLLSEVVTDAGDLQAVIEEPDEQDITF